MGSQQAALADPAAGPDAAPMSWMTTREYKRAELARSLEARVGVAPDETRSGNRAGLVGLDEVALDEVAAIPVGSLRMHCACCKDPYVEAHPFYHQLCHS